MVSVCTAAVISRRRHGADFPKAGKGFLDEAVAASTVTFTIAAQLDALALVRTLVAAIASFNELEVDSVSDLRLAVDEASTRLIRSAAPAATLAVAVSVRREHLTVSLQTECHAANAVLPADSFSRHVWGCSGGAG